MLIDSIGGKCFFGYYCFEGFMDFIVCELGIYYGGIEVINLSVCVFCIVGKFCNILGLFVFDGICFVGYYCFVGQLVGILVLYGCLIGSKCI